MEQVGRDPFYIRTFVLQLELFISSLALICMLTNVFKIMTCAIKIKPGLSIHNTCEPSSFVLYRQYVYINVRTYRCATYNFTKQSWVFSQFFLFHNLIYYFLYPLNLSQAHARVYYTQWMKTLSWVIGRKGGRKKKQLCRRRCLQLR